MPNKWQDHFGDLILFDCPTDGTTYSIAVANRVWDPGSMMWVSQTQSSGGGGAVTIADGADVAEGATTDAAIVADAAGTVSAKLRGLVKIAAQNYGTWNYVSSTLTSTGTVTGSGKCIGIRVFCASLTDGSFNINGGNTIAVRAGAGVDVNPGGNLVAPTVNWVSGTIDVIIEGLT